MTTYRNLIRLVLLGLLVLAAMPAQAQHRTRRQQLNVGSKSTKCYECFPKGWKSASQGVKHANVFDYDNDGDSDLRLGGQEGEEYDAPNRLGLSVEMSRHIRTGRGDDRVRAPRQRNPHGLNPAIADRQLGLDLSDDHPANIIHDDTSGSEHASNIGSSGEDGSVIAYPNVRHRSTKDAGFLTWQRNATPQPPNKARAGRKW